jgi:glycosyltransferase involved in cell wall biosynthesis
MTLPSVSVIIPCFNHGRFLRAAIASVRGQDYPAVDLLVVDDGSTDGSHAIGHAHGARVLMQPNLGVSAARNLGLEHARGELVVFLDADDELMPGAIASGVQELQAHPDAACVVRRCQLMDATGRSLPTNYPQVKTEDLYREWLLWNFVWTPGAAIFRRTALQDIGGFPEDVSGAADYAVYLRLARDGRVVFQANDAVRYRQHGSNMSQDPALMLSHTLMVLRRERPHVPRDYAAAYSNGRRAWAAFYGDQMIERMRREWHAGRRCNREQLRAGLQLLANAPRVLSVHAARKLTLMTRRTPRPTPTLPGRFAPGR